MHLEHDQDDYGDGGEESVVAEADERIEVTCLGCGEVFLAAWWDDCPVCGAPADGA